MLLHKEGLLGALVLLSFIWYLNKGRRLLPGTMKLIEHRLSSFRYSVASLSEEGPRFGGAGGMEIGWRRCNRERSFGLLVTLSLKQHLNGPPSCNGVWQLL